MYLKERQKLDSAQLERVVTIDCIFPEAIRDRSQLRLLVLNDGQNVQELGLFEMLGHEAAQGEINPLIFVAAVHAGERFVEFGTASQPDYLGRGSKATAYTRFVIEELMPFLLATYNILSFKERVIAGFSLGGLSAMDICWAHPEVFTCAGVFSGSLWWRSKALDEGYVEDRDRIMHALVRKGTYVAGLKFYFQTGGLDETMDRNHNGIIDSIDDTLALIDELLVIGYKNGQDIRYNQIDDGRHDIATWARAMPHFLRWIWPVQNVARPKKKYLRKKSSRK